MSNLLNASAILEVDLGALSDNFTTLQKYVGPDTEIAPVIKTNAYGLGAKQVAQRLQAVGAKQFFVATFEEGLALRNTLKHSPIIILNGLWPEVMPEAATQKLTPVLSNINQIRDWKKTAQSFGRTLPFWLQVDTGLNRLGLTLEEAERFSQDADCKEGLSLESVMSHLASSYQKDSSYNEIQRRLFNTIASSFPGTPRSFSNSGGLLHGKKFFYDIVRPGRFLYGSKMGNYNNLITLKPVVSLKARILQVRMVPQGETIGYDQTFRTSRLTKMATVSLGYADGYFQSLSNKGAGIIEGYKAPVIGRISMDLTTLDVTDIPPSILDRAQWIEFLGETITLDDLATLAQTNAWEILTHMGKRLQTHYIN